MEAFRKVEHLWRDISLFGGLGSCVHGRTFTNITRVMDCVQMFDLPST